MCNVTLLHCLNVKASHYLIFLVVVRSFKVSRFVVINEKLEDCKTLLLSLWLKTVFLNNMVEFLFC